MFRTFIVCAVIASLGIYFEPGYVTFPWKQAIRVTLALWFFCLAVRTAIRVPNPLKAYPVIWAALFAALTLPNSKPVLAHPIAVAGRVAIGAAWFYLPFATPRLGKRIWAAWKHGRPNAGIFRR